MSAFVSLLIKGKSVKYHMLEKTDPQIANLIKQEEVRHKNGLNFIASENYPSKAVLKVSSSVLTAKYAEGYPDKRYYSGMKYIDKIETLAIERAKRIFNCQYANVQPHSGSQANQAAYMAVLKPEDKVLSMSLSSGGHLTHGSKFNFSGAEYSFYHYSVDKKSGLIDYDQIEKLAKKIKPKLIVCGASAYPRHIDFKKFSKIAKKVDALLLADIAHIAGLIVAGQHEEPFPYCDIVTSTTHKTLRGPRGGLILAKHKFAKVIDQAVFPGLQGGPMMQAIAAKAVCFKEAQGALFKKYAKQVILNAQILAETLKNEGIDVVTGGSDNHIVLVDLSKLRITGQWAQDKLEKNDIYVNKNKIPFDKRPASNPSGIRLGTAALTSRGLKEKDMVKAGLKIANILKNK